MIQQWVYAYSCWNRPKKAGERAVRGFGTFSWTDGLSADDIEELERRCGNYELPAGVSTLPGAEARAALPLAAQSFRLGSGKRVIARTVYVGEGFWDHRPGAILAHAMVKESGDWEGYPAEWMDSPSFWSELPKAVQEEALRHLRESGPTSPPALPALEERAFGRSGAYAPGRVADHFRAGAARERLVRLFSLWAETAGRTDDVTFGDDGTEAPWLVAGFSMLFPLRMAQEISWATRLPSSGAWRRAGRHDVAGADFRCAQTRLEHVRTDPDAEAWVAAVETERKAFFCFLGEFPDAKVGDWRILLQLWRLSKGGASAEGGMSDECLEYLARHGTDAGVRRVFGRAVAEGGAGGGWGRLMDVAARSGRPIVLAAAIESCPDERRLDAWTHGSTGGAGAVAGLATGLAAAGGAKAGCLLARSWVAGGGVPRLMEMFRELERLDARLAAAAYFGAWQRAGGGAETAEELSWLTEKMGWVPGNAQSGYIEGVDQKLPGRPRQAEVLKAALPRFVAKRPSGAGPGKADVLLWALSASRHFSEEAIRQWAGLEKSFCRFRPDELAEWRAVLVPAFFEGVFPADPRAGAAAHGVALRSLAAWMAPEERRKFIAEYVGKAVGRLDRRAKEHPAGDMVLGTLVRLALGPDEFAPALRDALQAKVYPKGRFGAAAFEAERRAPALAGLSVAEERGWGLWKAERAAGKEAGGWLARIGRWFTGGEA